MERNLIAFEPFDAFNTAITSMDQLDVNYSLWCSKKTSLQNWRHPPRDNLSAIKTQKYRWFALYPDLLPKTIWRPKSFGFRDLMTWSLDLKIVHRHRMRNIDRNQRIIIIFSKLTKRTHQSYLHKMFRPEKHTINPHNCRILSKTLTRALTQICKGGGEVDEQMHIQRALT